MATAGTKSSEAKLTVLAAVAVAAISAYSPATLKPEKSAEIGAALVGAYALSRGVAKRGTPTT